MGERERLSLIKKIQGQRGSKVITYVVGDRPNLNFQIGSDTPRLFYDHLVRLGDKIPRLDLFLYSIGGDTSVPWRIISLLREFAGEVNVLVPHRAYSAATMICMGSDSILMGRKGELGPIDPAVTSEFNPIDPVIQNRKTPINVEDVTSYRDLIKERFGIVSSEEISKALLELTKAVNPVALGYINRHYSFIRMVATKLLKSHNKPCNDTVIEELVKELIEKIYFHGHGIARKEAKSIGLQVVEPDLRLEKAMWGLYLEYEKEMTLSMPFVPEDILEDQKTDSYTMKAVSGAYIESENFCHVFETDVKLTATRAVPQNLAININFQMPRQADQARLENADLRHVQQQIQQVVQEEVRRQSPVVGFDSRVTRLNWHQKDWH